MLKKINFNAIMLIAWLPVVLHAAEESLSTQVASLSLNASKYVALGIRGTTIAGAGYAGHKAYTSLQEARKNPSKTNVAKTVAWMALCPLLWYGGKGTAAVVEVLGFGAAIGSIFTIEALKAFYSR